MEMNWQRARQPDQKAARTSAILQAAARLFDERELSSITMRDLANEAGLGKASVYHYYKTKEEVFISLYRAELDTWLSSVESRLQQSRFRSPERVASVLTEVLREHQRFCRLAVVLSSVLEHNLSSEFIRDFKASLLPRMERFGTLLGSRLPHLTPVAIGDFVYQYHAMVAGLWPVAHPSDDVAQVLSEEPFRGLQIDFYAVFQRTIHQLLQKRP